MIRTIGIADREILEQNLKRLKLRHVRHTLDAINEVALTEEPSYLDFLAYLVQQEIAGREATQKQRRLKAAHFPVWRTLDEFDFSFQVSVSQQTVRDLATLDFIENRENLILLRISAGSGQPFRKHPDAVSELSGQHNGHIRTPCRVGKTFGTL
jgi:hypothetical protein